MYFINLVCVHVPNNNWYEICENIQDQRGSVSTLNSEPGWRDSMYWNPFSRMKRLGVMGVDLGLQ